MQAPDNAGGTAELETLTRSLAIEITVGGETLTVTPLTFGELPRFLRGGREFLAALDARAGQPLDLLDLVEGCGESITMATAIATRKAKTFIEALTYEEIDRLVGVVMEVNQDFFVRRLMTAAQRQAVTEATPASAAPSDGPEPASA